MKLRFFSAFELAMATFYSDLLPHLAAAGHSVEVVISRAEYRAGRRLEDLGGPDSPIRVFRTAHLGLQPASTIRSTLVMAIYLVHMALYTLLGPGADRNVFLTTPPLLPLWGWVLSRLRGQAYTCIVMDVYPELFVAYGRLRRDALLTRWFGWLVDFALRRADSVIVIGRCMAQRIQAKGVPAERIHTIPNWMNEQLVAPVPHAANSFRQAHGLDGKFVVLYSGNMGHYHYFDDVLQAAERLRDEAGLVFVFVGDGLRRPAIEAWVRERGLTNVRLLPYQPAQRLNESLSAGDLHLVTLLAACTGLAVPSKSYGILAAGRPLVYQGDSGGEIARLIAEEGVGAVVEIGDVDGLVQCIRRYAGDAALGQAQGQQARRLVEGPYSRAAALARYEATLTRRGAGRRVAVTSEARYS